MFTDYYDKDKLIEFNDFCRSREKPIGFIYTGCLGLFGFVFVDFSKEFIVHDPTDLNPKEAYIRCISNEAQCQVLIVEDENTRSFAVDDFVKVADVLGMAQINDREYKIISVANSCLTLDCDTTSFDKYLTGGIVKEVKKSQKIEFKSLKQSFQELDQRNLAQESTSHLKEPHPERGLHATLNTTFEFVAEHKRLPRPNDQEDTERFLKLYYQNSYDNQKKDILVYETQLIKNVGMFAGTQICPHTTFFGAIAAIEAIKITGKLIPLTRWFHEDSFALLPDKPVDRTIQNCRYDDQIALFGREFQEDLLNKR